MQKKAQIQTPVKTYLQQSLRNGRIVRWADNIMPLKVYIAPFRFYSKKGEDYKYRDMVMKAFTAWQKISGGKFSFVIVPSLLNSQINLDWKRVDRKALGHCYFNIDGQNRLYSAEIQIGLSDGLIHHDYMPEEEVYHTILHEVGHALGLGHSSNEQDIMYTPHKIGVVNLSQNDKSSLQWLYKFPSGALASEVASRHGFPTHDIDQLVSHLIRKNEPSDFEKVKESLKYEPKDLLKEQDNIADLKKYNIALQNVKISEDMRKYFTNQPPKRK